MNKNVIIILCFFILLSPVLLINHLKYSNKFIKKEDNLQENEVIKNNPKVAGFWTENFVHVNNNWTQTNSSNLWCNGKGTKMDPYLIENVTVDGNGDEICILIENTREFFEIRNCIIKNAEIGIKIINTTNFKIANSTIYNINGLNGANGPYYFDGDNANLCSGIYIINCSNFECITTKIFEISGGNGGKGSNGADGTDGEPGRKGGKGGNTYGIIILNSTKLNITNCDISNIFGGKGGLGGNGGWGINGDPQSNGGKGGSGGSGGDSYGFFINKSREIILECCNISFIKSGDGGNGGLGGLGGMAPPLTSLKGGNGGKGGDGGDGGVTGGILLFEVHNISTNYNIFYNISSGNGGNGGTGGQGGVGALGTTAPLLINDGPGGDGGNGGEGGDIGNCSIFYSLNSLNLSNLFNILINISNGSPGLGGSGGPGGLGGSGAYGAPPGIDGSLGDDGSVNLISGFYFVNVNFSLNYYNTIYSDNNYDDSDFNRWDNGNLGNFWSNHQGIDENPVDGIFETNYTLDGVSKANDTKPLIFPLIFPINNDYDADGISNIEEFTFESDGYITNASNSDTDYDGLLDNWEILNLLNPTNNDSDNDSFGDGLEFGLNTDPLNLFWYPMPNLLIVTFKDIIVYENTSYFLEFSVKNNGIWKAEGVNIIICCQSENSILYNNSNTPIDIDVDEIINFKVEYSLINNTGEYTLELIIDQLNIVNETYSNKDGTLNPNGEKDNSQQATLIILSKYQPSLTTIIDTGDDDNDDNEDSDLNEIILITTLSIITAYSIISTIGVAFLLKKFKSLKKLVNLSKKKITKRSYK